MIVLLRRLLSTCHFVLPICQLWFNPTSRRLLLSRSLSTSNCNSKFRSTALLNSKQMSELFDRKVIILAGATSSGKSAASLEIAKLVNNVEILIADSVQVYRDLNIA